MVLTLPSRNAALKWLKWKVFTFRFSAHGRYVDEDPLAAERAINDLQVAFPVLFDADSRIADLFSVDAMPTTIIIDKDGNIRHWHRGYQAGYEDSYAEQVAQLIRE